MFKTTIFFIALFSFSLFYNVGFAQQQRPNVVLILSDDQGYHDLGAYGSEEVKTPALDRLVSEGVRLTNFYVTSACTPTQSMLNTGRYPRRNGTFELFRNDRVDDGHMYSKYEYSVSPERILGTDLREVFISEVLDEAGYYNGYVGKWDLGRLKRYLPLQQGFDEFYGFPVTGIDYFTHKRYGIPSMYDGNKLITRDKGIYTTDLFEREALEFLDHASDDNAPFFLFLAFNAPHGNSELKRERKSQNNTEIDSVIRYTVPATEEFLRMYPDAKPKSRGYMAAITEMDHAIGNILKRVDEMGETNNTLVIFLTDNGGSGLGNNSPLRGGKAQQFEGGIRVPCIIKWPGHLQGGITNNAFLSGLEIFPTIASAAGANLPDSVVYDGFDMLPVLQDEMKSVRNKMFWQFRGNRAARINQWKWVSPKNGSGGLFNLSKDIGEEHDLSDKYPENLEMMKTEFKVWQQKMEEAPPRGPFKNY